MLLTKITKAVLADAEARRMIRSCRAYPPVIEREVLATYARLRRRKYFKMTRRADQLEQVMGASMRFTAYHTLEYLFREIFVEPSYAFRAGTKTPRIIDCGSNIGMSVLFFKTLYPDAEILAFEPGRTTYALLAENVQRNAWQDVRVLPQAVAEEDGELEFFYDPNDPGSLLMSTYAQRMPNGSSHRVEAVRLSRYIDAPVDFLKLDVEGAELGVLRDLQRSGTLPLVREMVIEYHHHITHEADALAELLAILESGGFGYQLSAEWQLPHRADEFQDVLVHAYRRETRNPHPGSLVDPLHGGIAVPSANSFA
jgi:FkbM family methyltransferase